MSLYSPNSNIIGAAPKVRTGMFDLINDQVNFQIVPNPYVYYDIAKRASYPGSGTTVYDLSPNGNNATIENSTSYIPFYNGNTSEVMSDFLYFPGSSNYQKLSLGSSLDFGNQFTVCAVIRPLGDSDIQPLICNIPPGSTTEGFFCGWNTWNTTDRKFRLLVGVGQGGSNKLNLYSSASAFNYGQWIYVTWSFDKTNSLGWMQKNGSTMIGVTSLNNMDFDTTGNEVTIGCFNSTANGGNSFPMACHINSLIIYNRLLSTAEQNHNMAYFAPRFGGNWL